VSTWYLGGHPALLVMAIWYLHRDAPFIFVGTWCSCGQLASWRAPSFILVSTQHLGEHPAFILVGTWHLGEYSVILFVGTCRFSYHPASWGAAIITFGGHILFS